MIFWRNGKGGFKGGYNVSIRGFFSYQHSVASEDAIANGHHAGIVAVFSTANGSASVQSAASGELSVLSSIKLE